MYDNVQLQCVKITVTVYDDVQLQCMTMYSYSVRRCTVTVYDDDVHVERMMMYSYSV